MKAYIDYNLIYSTVVKSTTIRIVISLTISRGYKLHQLGVKNAFLYGKLTKLVFMKQHPDYEDKDCLNHVCKVNKAIYRI